MNQVDAIGTMFGEGHKVVAKSSVAAQARAILEKKIEDGRKSAAHLFEHINTHVPDDVMTMGAKTAFHVDKNLVHVQLEGVRPLTLHRNAISQIAQRTRIPGAYLAELVAGSGWQRELAAEVLNRTFTESPEINESRYLVRSVHGEARGFLSDRYRRLDCRPLVDAFAGECQKVGAVPVDGIVSDTRISLRALLPTIYEPIPGEVVTLGIEQSNSDYGNGKHAIRAFIYRVWCLNTATTEDAMGQVHLGGRLGSDIALSARTYELDTATTASALGDVVRGLLAPAKVAAMMTAIRESGEKVIDWKTAAPKIAKRLLKGELDQVRQTFEQDADPSHVPAAKTVYKLSNALSWLANNTPDADRKLELQRYAGEVLTGAKDKEVVDAA